MSRSDVPARGIRLRHVAERVEGGGDGEELGVGGGQEALVGIDGDQFAAVERGDDEAPARAFQAGLFEVSRARSVRDAQAERVKRRTTQTTRIGRD